MGGRALTGGTGSVSDRGGERVDRAGPAPEGKRTVAGVRAVRSRLDGGNQTGETDVHEAAPLLSAAVRSPELRQAQARVGPRSPELGRGKESATMNSMARKRP
jgi:hypothetical protein